MNASRLVREMEARCPGDPWTLDLQHICSRLASGEFRVSDIRPAAMRRLEVQTGAGSWFLESPFHLPIPAGANGTLILDDVSLGMHYLFAEQSNVRYLVYVQQDRILVSEDRKREIVSLFRP